MSGQDTFPMTPLDQMVSSESLQILKAAVPYAPPSARKLLSVFAKFQEFKTALSLFPRFRQSFRYVCGDPRRSLPLRCWRKSGVLPWKVKGKY